MDRAGGGRMHVDWFWDVLSFGLQKFICLKDT